MIKKKKKEFKGAKSKSNREQRAEQSSSFVNCCVVRCIGSIACVCVCEAEGWDNTLQWWLDHLQRRKDRGGALL